MRLITAHKILIGSAVLFFFGFGLFELRAYTASHSLGDLASGIFGLVAALGFGVYLRNVYVRSRAPR